MSKDIQGASPVGDRAVVNGAASVSALRASVPSAVDRAEVLALCEKMAGVCADYALYGEPENARQRESAEAAATKLRHQIAALPDHETLCAECGTPCRGSDYGLPPACCWSCAAKIAARRGRYTSKSRGAS